MRHAAYFALWLAACAAPDTDTDTDAPDTDVAFVGCDYADIAGLWSGTGESGGQPYAITLDIVARADVGAHVADEGFSAGEGASAYTCDYDATCLGTTQLDWRVVQERALPGPCEPDVEYAFYRLESDGTLTYEASPSEFGERISSARLTR